MFSSTVIKMSLEASDLQTDEDCEDLVEDGFSLSADMSEHEKRTRMKRCLRKPPPSPRSPYLSSLNVNPRRPAVPAWKPLVSSSRGERVDSLGEAATARFTSLSNGHGLLQTVRSECDVTPEFLKQATKKTTQYHSASNGYSLDHREKEDMYDEIIHLKKSLQAQKADNQQMKAKLRRLEEDKNKREKQIEELLDPTKGSEYTRSLVDKKNEASVVLNGLKQRILKLEQQCREKENALSKLQSELRTTNLEEMKIMVETYFEEIRRLRMLVEAAEKSGRAESKGSQRQQKALGSMVQRLSEELKQLQQENGTLREELNTSGPVGGAKGYREWSKQRLLRRLLEVEKRLEDSRRHAHSVKNGSRLDQGVQTTPESEILVGDTRGVSVATEPAVSGVTAPSSAQAEEEACTLRESVSQLERHREELQHTLTNKDEELNRLRKEKEESERETERWKAEQTDECDKERQSHKQELEELRLRIQALEEERRQAAALASSSSSSPTTAEQQTAGLTTGGQTDGGGEGQTDAERKDEESKEEEEECGDEELRERAARSIQTGWREHRDRDIVKMQSAIRGHLHRHALLRDLQKDTHTKASLSQSSSEVTSPAEGELDAVALTMIQSVFRGHLARCSVTTESSKSSTPSSLGNLVPIPAPRRTHSTCTKASTGQTHRPDPLEPGAANAMDSDDSDDIIVSPSRPLRAREMPLF